jgi:hypothetical protein
LRKTLFAKALRRKERLVVREVGHCTSSGALAYYSRITDRLNTPHPCVQKEAPR